MYTLVIAMNNDVNLVDAVLSSGVVIPTPGNTLIALQKAGSNEMATSADYVRAVSVDPAVTGAVMRIANSPVFGRGHESKTIDRAVAVVGYTKLMAITASISLRSYIELLDNDLRISVEYYFHIAQKAAEYAYLFARLSKYKTLADSAYLCALVQDSGIFVLASRNMSAHCIHDPLDGHSSLGESIMRNWKMPPDIVKAVGLHHNPARVLNTPGDASLIACFSMAGVYAAHGGYKLSEVTIDFMTNWAPVILQLTGISVDVLNDCIRDGSI